MCDKSDYRLKPVYFWEVPPGSEFFDGPIKCRKIDDKFAQELDKYEVNSSMLVEQIIGKQSPRHEVADPE